MKQPEQDVAGYDRKTLLGAAAVFVGFCAIAFFLPNIMTIVGTDNPYLTGGVIAAFLVLPFFGLWWRGRIRARQDNK